MSKRIIIAERAGRDIRQARAWYESEAPGTGDRLVEEIDNAIAKIVDWPTAFPEVEPDIRRALCKKYPYKVFYTIEPDQIVILAVYHTARDPKRWNDPDR